MKTRNSRIILFTSLLLLLVGATWAQSSPPVVSAAMEQEIRNLMDAGHIPGLSLIVVKDGRQEIKTFGYADVAQQKPVTPATIFEIGSCSKAFTALVVSKLIQEGRLDPAAAVSQYIPWLTVTYKGKQATITVQQLLHHTSGIPWSSIARIPQTNAPDALEQTVRQLKGLELARLPGKKYEYATINYDVLALIVQQITHQPFEEYLQTAVLDKLSLHHTKMGYPADPALKATGYKIGFFKARPYAAPVFRGNNAAGYMMSDATDMGRWLQFQLGLADTAMYAWAKYTQQRDETVPPHNMSSYGMGWEVSLKGDGEITHGGLNPNFTAYVALRPGQQAGLVVMANSNSAFTTLIGNKLMKMLVGEEIEKEYNPGDGNDKMFSLVTLLLAGYFLLLLYFIVTILLGIVRKKRSYEPITGAKVKQAFILLVLFVPLLYGIYVLPEAIFNFNWEAIAVWAPVSFGCLAILLVSAMALSYITYCIELLFPEHNKIKNLAPRLLLLSVISGLANMAVVALIASSLESSVALKYLIFYYALAIATYLLGRRFVQISLIRLTMGIIYDLRVKLTDKIFATSYQKFEKIDRGRIYTALNDDVNTIGESANMFVVLVTSVFTAIGAFLYLASVASWATGLTIGMVLLLVVMYYLVSKRAQKYYNGARDTKNVFMRLINGMIDGFKELSLHRNKKEAYKQDVFITSEEYRAKMCIAGVQFANASLFGEAILVIILGMVAFGFPELFPGIKTYTLMSFLVVLLYLIGPVNSILGAMPAVMKMKIAWNRTQRFLNDIPANTPATGLRPPVPQVVDNLRVEGVEFRYQDENGQDVFTVGPINLEVNGGEILFIIGANGSGKTTLAKLITGLYEPDKGRFRINGDIVDAARLGECFSTVFSPIYLFKKLYNIDVKAKAAKAEKYLKLLQLDKKVTIEDNTYSTIDLSGGQRKRLGLLQCYLEETPVFLFDEWAADQDPVYRHFFYRTLLPEMKKMGKIVIAITHDDHYFDVADKVLKMESGQLEHYNRTIVNL
ncbi:cyclic peptide export ABC transporter [Chitinophaga nivalis]|uniref:Cyclic peptide export ABC transporter n=1 Tax=Chitinophaga nivalis TaxID=2991709 RepID=A0ABT3IJT4_9BACT|nr:cyclic peptide export ABC transporter [Chitinophaga nivalis]MCW3466078.1 cyclic peptide export ABC transporter [Chitinophaga nivalis]MCW3484231.1 cyclic peptide export ABC transporter [Chitinophaga nivalis]